MPIAPAGAVPAEAFPWDPPSAPARESEAPLAPDLGTDTGSTCQLGQIRPIDPIHGARHPEQALGGPRVGASFTCAVFRDM